LSAEAQRHSQQFAHLLILEEMVKGYEKNVAKECE
jgi:hypothetical protein